MSGGPSRPRPDRLPMTKRTALILVLVLADGLSPEEREEIIGRLVASLPTNRAPNMPAIGVSRGRSTACSILVRCNRTRPFDSS